MNAQAVWEQAQLGANWLARQQDSDGEWRGLTDPAIDGYYKASWALSLAGRLPEGHRSLDYVAERFMSDGDFSPRQHPWHRLVHYVYPNAYVILGAMALGRYEIAVPATRFVLSLQHSGHGGVPSRGPDADEYGGCDTMSAAAAGIAPLAAGQLDHARKAGEFLARVIETQPNPATHFFARTSAAGALVTEPAEDEAFASVVDTQEPGQCWYAVGLPFAFMVRLHQATGLVRYQTLARWLFEFQLRCVGAWDGGSSGKAGWACAMLYRVSGEREYRDVALHVAGYMGGRQDDDGGWTLAFGDGSLTNSAMDVSAEYTLWSTLIAANLLARDRR